MKTLRNHEGYLMIDNRVSQGIDDATMIAMGYPVGAGKGLFESATYTCSHCHAVVVIEPKRTRERGFCRKCNQRVCDSCETIRVMAGGACRSMAQIIDETLESAVKQADTEPTSILLIP